MTRTNREMVQIFFPLFLRVFLLRIRVSFMIFLRFCMPFVVLALVSVSLRFSEAGLFLKKLITLVARKLAPPEKKNVAMPIFNRKPRTSRWSYQRSSRKLGGELLSDSTVALGLLARNSHHKNFSIIDDWMSLMENLECFQFEHELGKLGDSCKKVVHNQFYLLYYYEPRPSLKPPRG